VDEFSDLEFDLSKPIDEITNAYHRQQAIDQFAPRYEARLVKSKNYKGFYRLGKMPDFDDKVEKYEGLVQRLAEDTYSDGELPSWAFWVLFSPFIVLFIALLIFAAATLIPILIVLIPFYVLSHITSILFYKAGFFPRKSLTVVEHLYVHPDGRVVVPVRSDLKPFSFEVNEKMVLVTHYHEGVWQSVSMVRRRRQYFQLKSTYHGREHLDVQEVYTFLAGFGLRTKDRHTTSDNGGGGGGG
jgi:hypothetical protein